MKIMPKMEKLISVPDEVELGIISEILEKNNVPFIIQDTSMGMRIYSGNSLFGTEIQVEEHDLERARELIANFLPDEDNVE